MKSNGAQLFRKNWNPFRWLNTPKSELQPKLGGPDLVRSLSPGGENVTAGWFSPVWKEKENHLTEPNLHDFGLHFFIFRAVIFEF